MPAENRWTRWTLLEWMTIASFVLAVLGFFGFSNWRTIVNVWNDYWQSPARIINQQKPVSKPSQWQPPSDLADQNWSMRFKERDIVLYFTGGPAAGDVRMSDSLLGTQGHWRAEGRNVVMINTTSYVIAGTLTTDGEAMNAVVYGADGRTPQGPPLTLRRVH